MKNIFFAQAQGSRKEQQDFFGEYVSNDPIFIHHGGRLAIVADGMGGLEKGADASKIAVHSFIDSYKAKRKDESIPDALKRSVISANKAVYNFSTNEGLSGKTGSTLVALVQCKNEVYWLSVGDSRIYQISNNKLKQLSTDHNYENDLLKLVEKGELTLEDVRNNSQKAALTSYIGSESIAKIDQNTQPVIPSPKDVFMLASDGLYARLADEEITSIVLSDQSNEAAKKLIKCKLEKKLKNQDNLTVSLVFQVKPVHKSKTKKMIVIWMMLFLLPLIGASILFEDPFFYNYIKSTIFKSESAIEQEGLLPENIPEFTSQEIQSSKKQSSDMDTEAVMIPDDDPETDAALRDEIMQQGGTKSIENQNFTKKEMHPEGDKAKDPIDDRPAKAEEQKSQVGVNELAESASPKDEEAVFDSSSQTLIGVEEKKLESATVEVKNSESIKSFNDNDQIKIIKTESLDNNLNKKNIDLETKGASEKVTEIIQVCEDVFTGVISIRDCKDVEKLVDQPIQTPQSSSPKVKQCKKEDEEQGSQNRYLPICEEGISLNL